MPAGGGRRPSATKQEKCPDCKKPAGDETIQCGVCSQWFHQDCQGLSADKFAMLSDADVLWGCSGCKLDSLLKELREIRSLRDTVNELKTNFDDFKTTMVAKLDSLTNVAPQVTQPAVPDFETLVKVQQEIEERREKKPRTVLFGLPEQPAGANQDGDLLEVRRLATELKLDPRSVTSVFRDGQRKPGSSRILKVCWSDREERLSFMRTVRDLRDKNQRWRNIWSRPDQTWLQREQDKALRMERQRRIDAGESVYISRGKIHVKNVGGGGNGQ